MRYWSVPFRSVVLSLGLVALLAPSAASACARPIVYFTFGSTKLLPRHVAEVASVVEQARTTPDPRVRLTAPTDGSKANLQMARRRVALIKAALVQGGVSARTIDVQYVEGSGAFARTISMDVISSPTCG
jgi:hypothetical protein